MRRASSLLLLATGCVAAPAAAPRPLAGLDTEEPIVVSRLAADHLTLGQREVLTATLAEYLRASLPNQILTQDAISRMIEEEQRKDLLGCDEVACYSQIAEKFGARYLIGGRLAELGSDLRAQVTLLDTGGIQEKIGQGDAPACDGLAPVAVLRAAANLLDRRQPDLGAYKQRMAECVEVRELKMEGLRQSVRPAEPAGEPEGMSVEAEREVLERAVAHGSGHHIELAYGFFLPLHGRAETGFAHDVVLSYARAWGFLRYGGGAHYAGGRDVQAWAIFGSLALQLTHIGADSPLHFGVVALVPYADVEAGLGHATIRDAGGDAIDFGSLAPSVAVVQNSVGVRVPLNVGLSVVVRVTKRWTQDQSIAGLMGLSLRLGDS